MEHENLRRNASVIALGLAAQLACTARADDRRTDKSQVTIMHLNAEFLWDGEAPEEGNPQVKFDWKGSPVEAAAHMQAVAAIITRNNPDIVSLCEVENETALNKLNNDFLSGRGYRAYFAPGNDTFTGEDMGFLTRIDPEGDLIRYDNRAGQSGSSHKNCSKDYVAKLTINGEKIAMIGGHLLAHPDQSNRRLDRQAQADALRQMAVEVAGQGFQPIILGDMNDFDDDPTCIDRNGDHPITTVLKILKQMAPADANDDLVNVSSLVMQPERYTAYWEQHDPATIDFTTEVSEIDHFLIAPHLMDYVGSVVFDHTHDARQHPDHYPIIVHFNFGSGNGGGAPGQAIVRMTELLPNPAGDELQEEQITLVNQGATPADLHGWKVRDAASTTWSLDAAGTLSPGAAVVIKRGGQHMSMNNSGDTIELVDGQGLVLQAVTYGRVSEGEVVLAH